MNYEAQWMKKYELAKKYYEHYGHLKIPYSFKTLDGIHKNETGFLLGRWIRKQREAYRDWQNKVDSDYKITKERIELLEAIGMIWRLKPAVSRVENPESWMRKYELAKKYYEHHGHLYVVKTFKTIDGVNYNEKGDRLGTWIETQKKIYKKHPEGSKYLSQEKIKLLEEIEIDWIADILNNNYNLQKLKIWQKTYGLAKNYYNHYGNLLVPEGFKTHNGIDYADDGVNLAGWLNTQRNRKKGIPNRSKSLTEREENKLNSIGMVWEVEMKVDKVPERLEKLWNDGYLHAKEYYGQHGDLNLKLSYVCDDGYRLGNWISTQRRKYKENILEKEKIEKLNNISMVWDASTLTISKRINKNLSWKEAYNLCANFKSYYYHLDIPIEFKTNDGISEDPEGFELGKWLDNQRKAYDSFCLTEEESSQLKAIGCVLYIKENNTAIHKVCEKNKVAHSHANILSRLPVSEVKAKIRFLKTKNLPIVENEELNPIFFMSNKNIEAKYGVTLEQIMEEYKKSKAK